MLTQITASVLQRALKDFEKIILLVGRDKPDIGVIPCYAAFPVAYGESALNLRIQNYAVAPRDLF